MQTTRLSKDDYFMEIVKAVASRSTCLDKQVGCVLVSRNGIILATGYNGAPRSMQHCGTCRVKSTGNKQSCPAAHAEQNALLYAVPTDIFACYCSLEPCLACTRMLMNTTCEKVVFAQKTNPRHSGIKLWRELNGGATWEYRPSK